MERSVKRKSKEMGRYITIIIVTVVVMLATNEAAAQHSIGIRAGAGSGSARFDPKREMASVWGLPSFGISWRYYSKERILGGLEVDLMFMGMGYKDLDQEPIDPSDPESKLRTYATYQRKINTIIMPIAWQPHFYLFKRRARLFLNLAVTFSYNFSSTEKYNNINTGEKWDRDYPMKLTRDNPFGYGLAGGGGLGWMIGKFELVAEARYYFGLGDIFRNPNKYTEIVRNKSTPRRSPIDGLQIQLGLYYRLGKRGILAPPSKKEAQKL